MATSKIHELLAVKPNREAEATTILNDHISTFRGNHALFSGRKRVFTPSAEGDQEAQDIVEEELEMVTTVAKEFKFAMDKYAEAVDLIASIDHGNTQAVASVYVDGEVFLKDVPATFLVHLEKRINQVIRLVQSIPTADPVRGFSPDPDQGEHVLRARPIVRDRTKKIQEWITVVDATEHHPAQVKEQTRDEKIGTITTYEWSGLPTTSQKSSLINRAVKLKEAIVEARARANCLKVDNKKCFDRVTSYLMEAFEE